MKSKPAELRLAKASSSAEIWTSAETWKIWNISHLIEKGLNVPVYGNGTPSNYTTGYTGHTAGIFKGSDQHVTALAKRLIDAGWDLKKCQEMFDQGVDNASHLQVMPFYSGKVTGMDCGMHAFDLVDG